MSNVAILGTPVSSGNRGVMALAASLLGLCHRCRRGSDPSLLVGHRDNQPVTFRVAGSLRQIPVVHARLSPRTPPCHHLAWIIFMAMLYRVVPVEGLRRAIARGTPWIGAMRQAVFVGDIRGGDSFSDIYGIGRFMRGFLMAWTAILVRGSMVQFPQTYGPYRSPVARFLARFLLRRSAVIMARDKESQKVAQELAGPGREVLLSPDVAFSLEAVVPAPIELDPPLSGRSERPVPGTIIGVNINGLMFHGGYNRQNMFGLKLDYPRFLDVALRALLAVHPGEVWLVPHTYASEGDVESDPEASRRVRELLPEGLRQRVRMVAREYDCHEIKGVIGQCDFFLGSRMHACIAALSQGVPCAGVAYSMKFGGVFDSVGMGDWVVDGRTVDTESAVRRVLELYARRDEVRAGLKARAQAARGRLDEVFAELFARAGAGGS